MAISFSALSAFMPATLVPHMSLPVVVPVALVVMIAFAWWLSPVSAYMLVVSVIFTPVFAHPYVSRAWLFCPYYNGGDWPHMYVDLSRSLMYAARCGNG